MTKRYGNNNFWCFLEDGYDATRPIEVWQTIDKGSSEEVMAHASDKYNAQHIIDALIIADKINDDPDNKLAKKEVVFLQFVSAHCAEPWTTMADNAIMWNDREVYEKLKAKFNEIYT